MNVQYTDAMRKAEREIADRMRKGKATCEEAAFYDRLDRVWMLVVRRRNRIRKARGVTGWWHLPVAKAMWEGDARDLGEY